MTTDWSRRAVMAGLAGGAFAAAAEGARAAQAPPPPAGVQRLDPAFDALLAPDAKVEMIMDGFRWSEGPVWVGGRDGYLLVSDVPGNVIRKWTPGEGSTEFLNPSGYAGGPSPMFREPGTNGLIVARGGLAAADCGNRGLALINLTTKRKTMLCRDFEGKRFNSPNDLVLARDGSIYFTDPPYGLTGTVNSPFREMDYTGIFRLARNGTVTLVDRSVAPNGIALSPDGRTLYATAQGVGWVAWTLDAQGRASDKRVFIDSQASGVPAGDGMKIDAAGNLWASSRDGISVFNPQGKRIGIISTGDRVANCVIAADGHLYIASNTKVARIPVKARALRV
jgi:gluconolactonase